jgi:hypothetical protein
MDNMHLPFTLDGAQLGASASSMAVGQEPGAKRGGGRGGRKSLIIDVPYTGIILVWPPTAGPLFTSAATGSPANTPPLYDYSESRIIVRLSHNYHYNLCLAACACADGATGDGNNNTTVYVGGGSGGQQPSLTRAVRYTCSMTYCLITHVRAQEEEALKECTFKPKVNPTYDAHPVRSRYLEGVISTPGAGAFQMVFRFTFGYSMIFVGMLRLIVDVSYCCRAHAIVAARAASIAHWPRSVHLQA